jgi:hypothetical protein
MKLKGIFYFVSFSHYSQFPVYVADWIILLRTDKNWRLSVRLDWQAEKLVSSPAAWITVVMISLKDNIFVTDRDPFYQMETYTISSTWNRRYPEAEFVNVKQVRMFSLGILRKMPKSVKY